MSLNNENKKLKYFMNNPKAGLIKMALPIFIGFLIHVVYHIVDMYFVGKISTISIAALGFNMPIVFFTFGISMGLGTGITAVIAKYIGAKRNDMAIKTAKNGLVLLLLSGLILSSVILIFNKKILILMGIPQDLILPALSYLSIILFGIPVTHLSVAFRSIYMGEGESKTPMLILGVGTIINIILDPIFIFTFELGIKGAAWATVFSQFVVLLVYVFFVFAKKNNYLKLQIPSVNMGILKKMNKSIIKEIFNIGIPASLSMIIMSFGISLYNYIISIFSSKSVAAYQIVHNIEQFYFIPVISIAMASVTLIGMFYGAKKYHLVKYIVKFSILINVLIGIILSIIFVIITPTIFLFFTKDIEVVRVANSYFRVMVFIYPILSLGLTSTRVLQGFGTGLPSLVVTAVRVIVVSVPLALFFTHVEGRPIEWVWYSMATSTIVATIIGYLWLILRIKKI